MFKYSKDGISVLSVLDARRAKKSGLFPVKIQVIHNRKQKYYSTGKELSKEDWEILAESKSRRLIEIRASVENSFSIIKSQVEALAERGDFCFDALSMRLGRCTGTTLNTAIQGKIDAFKLNGQVNSYYNYRSTLKSIERFAGGSVPFSAVSADWLSRLDKFLRNEGKTVTTINFYMKALKCVVNDARRNGILKEAQYPFGRGKYEIPSGNSRKLALTMEQIKKVVTYKGSKTVEKYRDFWFFSYLCNGINFRDMLFLRYGNIVDGEICFVRSKTSHTSNHIREIRAVLTPEMRDIIKRWGNPDEGNPDTFLFKYAKDTEDEFVISNIVRRVTHRCNIALAKIAQAVGVPRFTTYSARHSYATVLKRSGTNIAYISESLGHSSLAITENYLASFEQEERIRTAQLLTKFD